MPLPGAGEFRDQGGSGRFCEPLLGESVRVTCGDSAAELTAFFGAAFLAGHLCHQPAPWYGPAGRPLAIAYCDQAGGANTAVLGQRGVGPDAHLVSGYTVFILRSL